MLFIINSSKNFSTFSFYFFSSVNILKILQIVASSSGIVNSIHVVNKTLKNKTFKSHPPRLQSYCASLSNINFFSVNNIYFQKVVKLMMSVPRENSEMKENKKGHIELILGPMFSGKSTELIRRLKRYKVIMK